MTNHDDMKAKFRADHARKPEVQAARAQSQAEQSITRYENLHPELRRWWKDAQPGSFQQSLRDSVAKWGSLTEKQLQAALDSATRAVTPAKSMDVSRIEHVFAVALKNGIKRPKLRLGSVVFGLGRQGTSYEHTIFVNDKDRTYLGRVIAGNFSRGRACTPEREAEIVKLGEDPLAAAVAYGKVTGECAICGRTLENADSIALGIGPICAEKVFG